MSRYIIIIFLGLSVASCDNNKVTSKTPIVAEVPPVKEEQTPPEVPVEVEVESGKIDTITVSSVEDIVSNAKSNTVMYLKKGKYELEEDLVYFMTKDERRIIDKKIEDTRSIGGQLFFSGLENFQIIGKKGAQVISKNPKAVAFFVLQAKNWKISNLTIMKEKGGTAEVSYFSNCRNVEIEKCNFAGGGTYGMYLNNVRGMKVKSSKISKCTTGVMRINDSKDISFVNSTFSNNICKVPLVNFYTTGSSLTLNNVSIIDNKKDPNSSFENSDRLFAVGNNMIRLDNCVIQNNVGYKYLGLLPSSVNRSQIDGVSMQ